MTVQFSSGDELLEALAVLANPHRLRIVTALTHERNYVSQLARELGISRPLLHMHLKRLEAVGLIMGRFELSEEGKAMKYYEVVPFELHLTPQVIAELANSLSDDLSKEP
jgi:predicted transcriptional regulator